ncbi:acylneuraminate cytidylyltransferase family protein [bacterium]|nr:acylneuraminate cytidylyltransferase family protein [bacterium]
MQEQKKYPINPQASRQLNQYERVLVSTDDKEIAQIARSFGAEVPFLGNSVADDLAPSSEATLAALKQEELHWGVNFDVVSQLMSNCPLRDATDITASVQNFIDQKIDTQLSCFRFGWMNPWWAARLSGSGVPDYLFPEAKISRSQDLPPLYCPSGALWIARVPGLTKSEIFLLQNTSFIH